MAVVVLSETQTEVSCTAEEQKAAYDAAIWLSASPHEWTWSRDDQIAMARYVLWAMQRLHAIKQLASGELTHATTH